MALFNEVCEKCLIKYKDLKVESLTDYFRPLVDLNFDEYIGTNKATENKVINDMKALLREPIQFSEDMDLMLIFDKGYMELRNKYILPLSQYSIGYRNLKNNNVKELIKNKIIKVQKDGDRKYVLFF